MPNIIRRLCNRAPDAVAVPREEFDLKDPVGAILAHLEVEPCQCKRPERPKGERPKDTKASKDDAAADPWKEFARRVQELHAVGCQRLHAYPCDHGLDVDDWLALLEWYDPPSYREPPLAEAVHFPQAVGATGHEMDADARSKRLDEYAKRAAAGLAIFNRKDTQGVTAAQWREMCRELAGRDAA